LSNVKGRCVVITGRGGTGKSTFVTLMTRFLGELGYKPLLIVDSDPDESLAEMLGVDLIGEGKETISEMIFDIIEGRKMSKMVGMTASDKIEPFLFQNVLYEGRSFFDFIAVGTKWSEGCYCVPDRALGQIIERWSTNYDYVVVDSPAGVEHLNRRITKEVERVFNILDPSKKSFDNAWRTHKIMKEVGMEYEDYYLVGGYRFTNELEEEAKKQPFEYLGRIEFDKNVQHHNLEGIPLLDLPEDSPAYSSVKEIIKRAGYTRKPPTLSQLLSSKQEK
jgi:CO dehydrogenase maturation factor